VLRADALDAAGLEAAATLEAEARGGAQVSSDARGGAQSALGPPVTHVERWHGLTGRRPKRVVWWIFFEPVHSGYSRNIFFMKPLCSYVFQLNVY
jgi:hypothetical protein